MSEWEVIKMDDKHLDHYEEVLWWLGEQLGPWERGGCWDITIDGETSTCRIHIKDNRNIAMLFKLTWS